MAVLTRAFSAATARLVASKEVPFHPTNTAVFRLQQGLRDSDYKDLSAPVSSMLLQLEQALKDNASPVRKAVGSFVLDVTSTKSGPLSASLVELRDPYVPGKVILTIKNGEFELSEQAAEQKLDRVMDLCVETARGDFTFLKVIKAALEGNGFISPADAMRLKAILKENSYWRCVEAVYASSQVRLS